MRKLSILAAMILAACGGSSSSPTYALKDAAATRASGTCAVTGVGTIAASVAFVGAADYTGACTSMTPSPGFSIPGSGALAELVIVRVDATPLASAPPLNAGTYQFYDVASGANPPADPANPLAGFKFFTGPVTKCTAADGGGGTAAVSAITGGTVVIDSVTATTITGSLNATIQGGTTFGGSFTAPNCATAPALDVATLCDGVNSGGITFPPFTCQ